MAVRGRRTSVRRLTLLPVLLLISASSACTNVDSGHKAARRVRVMNEMPIVSPSQTAAEERQQAAAETHALRVLRARPPEAAAPEAWRTVAISHNDHRLLLAVSVRACDTFLGVLVTDTPERVDVAPLVRKTASGTCTNRLDTFVGYVDFPAGLGTRYVVAASS